MIPKVAHFYWGNESMSFLRYLTLYSFSKLNPDWLIKVYLNNNPQESRRWQTGEKSDKQRKISESYLNEIGTLKNVAVSQFPFQFIYGVDPAISDVHIKDITNWYILASEGGIVADTDILFFRPVSEVLPDSFFESADIALTQFSGFPRRGYIPVSFMGGSGKNDFFTDVFERALANYKPNVYECCGTNCIGYGHLDQIREDFPHLNLWQLPDEIIYPIVTCFPEGEGLQYIHLHDRTELIGPEAIGVHWYGGSPVSSENNEILTRSNFTDKTSTLTRLIEKVIANA